MERIGALTPIDSVDQGGSAAWAFWGDRKLIYLADEDGGLHSSKVVK